MSYNFDLTLESDWSMPFCDRSLDWEKIEKYLSRLPPDHNEFTREVLKKTRYISYKEFYNSLIISFEKFTKAIADRVFDILLPKDKIGSEHWVLALLWPRIKKLNSRKIITKFDNNDLVDILRVDDCIYTGVSMQYIFDTLTYNKNISKPIEMHIVAPYATKLGMNNIFTGSKRYGKGINCNFYHSEDIPSLNELIPTRSPRGNPNFTEGMGLPALYFDHKVAGECSTYHSLYMYAPLLDGTETGALFKEKPSREKIKELETLLCTR